MEIGSIRYHINILMEFKIDLIVWKCLNYYIGIIINTLFKIDLIVWKLMIPVCIFTHGDGLK